MKTILTIFTIALLLPAAAFAGKKKSASAQDNTDWLNAPTPDGSPTLKETSDWLARTLADYGGDPSGSVYTVVQNVHIDNNCNFNYTLASRARDNKSYHETTEVSFALGAVTDVHIEGVDAEGMTHLVEDANYLAEHPNRLKANDSGSYYGVDDAGMLGQLSGFSVKVETGNVAAVHNVVRDAHGKWSQGSASSQSVDIEAHPEARAGAEVPQRTVQMLPRIVTALQHAVSLCQSAYTAPVQAKQPF